MIRWGHVYILIVTSAAVLVVVRCLGYNMADRKCAPGDHGRTASPGVVGFLSFSSASAILVSVIRI